VSLLKNLFGPKAAAGEDADPLAAQFDADWFRAVRRFAIVSGYGVDGFQFNLRHPETNELMAPHLGITPYFEDWKQIRSPWDRLDLFYRLIIGTRGVENFHPWAIANILTASRRPQEALETLKATELAEAGSEYYARHCGAFARALIPLSHPVEALQWAQTAATADPDDSRLQLLLGDALRFNGQCEEANAIYSGLMATAEPSPDEAPDPIGDMFGRVFALETGAVSSPFFALDIAATLGDPEQAEQFWKLGEAEFYDSPQFRMQHAYRLVAGGQALEGFAKLAALVNEMPWLREAQINLLQLFRHLDPAGDRLMPELRGKVEQTITEQAWTTEGMQLIQIPAGE
jgi:tetratricopeptide (TPR) repeat protein